MKARTVVFDLFGDYLRFRGGEVRLRGLIALMDCFGVREATVRVVVTRLRREGWLSSRRDGRETTYVLTDKAWRLLDEGRSRIFQRVDGPWDGRWHTVIYSVPETDRALREQLRKKLQWLGFGPLAQSVWVSPHDRVAQVRDSFADQSSIQLDLLHARSEGADHDRDIAARAWDLSRLDQDYARLLRRYQARMDEYRSGDLDGPEALAERMQLVYDYQKLPFQDPDLPAELLPDDWTGRAAHEMFMQVHSLLRAPAEAYVDELIAGTLGRTSERRAG
ncbi:PaaX family transcriptional regulator [Pseudonocardia spinosispora]|uniref:PaaX family transcriptional regulator n=1 Tax=Pseudonocardia spinosispora TaxID=103441 RepID=UPI00040C114C|nr:PaaX family transcriptional regulator C-terminal domain-containing protein [Pseudonocardia spinosispora]